MLTGLVREFVRLRSILSAINRGAKMVTFPDGRVAYNRESAVNLVDEQLEKPRLRNARQLLEEVENQLENY